LDGGWLEGLTKMLWCVDIVVIGFNVDHGVGIPNRSRHSMVSAGINRKDALFLASVACHGTYTIAYSLPAVPQVVCHLNGTPQD
jgi:hypothetical protein